MAKRRTIAVVTGSRAEFGLLKPIMRAITLGQHAPQLRLHTIVVGSHWAAGTWRDIPAAGFRIDHRVPMQRRTQVGRAADVAALGRGIAGFGRVFAAIQPTFVLLLGDRIEPLAAACAASVGGFRVAHLHGGDRGEGVADEAIRHAITKLAHLHLPASEQSRQRLIRMGEPASTIFRVGSPAIDDLQPIQPDPNAPELIVIQHPIGGSDQQERTWMQQTLDATCGYTRLVLAPNLDPGCLGIRQALRAASVLPIEHLPREQFLRLLAGCRAILGNSSAGLIEAAALRRPCVNIGPRQAGREKPPNVIDCDYGTRPVRAAIAKALKLDLRRSRHPYGDGRTGPRVARLLATLDLARIPIRKRNSY